MPDIPLPTDRPSRWARRSAAAGFTLVEVIIAGALMSLCATFAYATILVSNRTAVTNRLFTLAQEMARDRIDRLQCAAPYNPQMSQVPPDLALGTRSQTLPLYVDPTSNATVVTATLTTAISDLGSYNARNGLVTVSYTFRGRTYQVQMNTLRTSDS
jgi:prepilin-type N-terminal cleavage/methylation domain-containing protein